MVKSSDTLKDLQPKILLHNTALSSRQKFPALRASLLTIPCQLRSFAFLYLQLCQLITHSSCPNIVVSLCTILRSVFVNLGSYPLLR
jgi:hypothetical protein